MKKKQRTEKKKATTKKTGIEYRSVKPGHLIECCGNQPDCPGCIADSLPPTPTHLTTSGGETYTFSRGDPVWSVNRMVNDNPPMLRKTNVKVFEFALTHNVTSSGVSVTIMDKKGKKVGEVKFSKDGKCALSTPGVDGHLSVLLPESSPPIIRIALQSGKDGAILAKRFNKISASYSTNAEWELANERLHSRWHSTFF